MISTSASADAGGDATVVARPPMNVLLVVIDALRADMPWNGYPRDIAPNLTRLHARAVSYRHAYSVSSFTSKSIAAILSGRYPSELVRTTPFFTRFDASNDMIAESMQRAGVRTLSAQAHWYMDGRSGFAQGFDEWRLVPGLVFDRNKDLNVTSDKLTVLAIEMLSRPENVSGRFFAYVHYMDPHDEYVRHAQSPPFGGKPRDRYDSEVFYTDLWVQKLLEFVAAQPWAARTAVIVTADHGECLGEHDFMGHAYHLYEELVHVPMMFVVPGLGGRQIEARRGQIDLAPTILELAGVPIPESLQGRSLVAELFGAPAPERPVVCDLPADSHNERRRAIIEGGWKLVVFGNGYRYEMFHLLEDPGEKRNLYPKELERGAAMVRRYKEVAAGIREVPARGDGIVRK
jgi:arylsulfatase A-like enzyme